LHSWSPHQKHSLCLPLWCQGRCFDDVARFTEKVELTGDAELIERLLVGRQRLSR
jgi:hypothetical protein